MTYERFQELRQDYHRSDLLEPTTAVMNPADVEQFKEHMLEVFGVTMVYKCMERGMMVAGIRILQSEQVPSGTVIFANDV